MYEDPLYSAEAAIKKTMSEICTLVNWIQVFNNFQPNYLLYLSIFMSPFLSTSSLFLRKDTIILEAHLGNIFSEEG